MKSKYFKRSEFACKCGCGFDVVDAELLQVLEDLRITMEEPLVINSGCRCATHNKNEGGATSSLHMLGKAVDIRFNYKSKTPLSTLFDILISKYPDKYGIATEGSFVHLDVRPTKARWSY